MTERHMLDLPSPIDQVRLLCGPLLHEEAQRSSRSSRSSMITSEPAIVTCLACLRAHATRQGFEIEDLKRERDELKAELASRPSPPDP